MNRLVVSLAVAKLRHVCNGFMIKRETGLRAPLGRLQPNSQIWDSPPKRYKQIQHAVPLLVSYPMLWSTLRLDSNVKAFMHLVQGRPRSAQRFVTPHQSLGGDEDRLTQ